MVVYQLQEIIEKWNCETEDCVRDYIDIGPQFTLSESVVNYVKSTIHKNDN